jgi:hypothetical protein
MSSPSAPNPFVFTDALVTELQGKMRAALDGQSFSCLLAWACTLIAMPLPADLETEIALPTGSVSSEAMRLALADEESEPPPDQRWGFLVVTLGGEAFFMTPTTLRALNAANPLLFGQVKWSATVGLCSSPSAHAPLSDLAVTLIASPAWQVNEGHHYRLSEYLRAQHSHQDVVLLVPVRPLGFPP